MCSLFRLKFNLSTHLAISGGGGRDLKVPIEETLLSQQAH